MADPSDYYVAPDVHVVPFDVASLWDEHALQLGHYLAMAPYDDRAVEYQGMQLYVSEDGGTIYRLLRNVDARATMGYAMTALAATPSTGWDTTNSVDVHLISGALETVTQLEVENGGNWLYLGGEVLGFASVTELDENEYRLSTLLRGLRGTSAAAASHAAGENAVRIDENVLWVPANHAELCVQRHYKGISKSGSLADATAVAFKPLGKTVKPFAPTNVQGSRDGENDLTISWDFVSRQQVNVLGKLGIPRVERQVKWRVEIEDPGDPTTVVRTIESAQDTTSVEYTAAQQTADGYTPGNSVTFDLFQVSQYLAEGVRTGKITV